MFDVVVVGSGAAGLAAALAARQQGARVAVVEQAPQALRGGNTRFAVGVLRSTYDGVQDLAPVVRGADDPSTVAAEPYTPDDFVRDLDRVTGGHADRELGSVLAEESGDAVRWLADLGVACVFNRGIGSVAGPERTTLPPGRAITVQGDGLALSEGLFRALDRAGVPVFYESQVVQIDTSPNGEIVGATLRGAAGRTALACRSLVLASGGFQANPQMRAAYLGPAWSLARVRGSRFNTGEMLRAALELGAAPYGHWAGCHATLIDASAPLFGDLALTHATNRLGFSYSVMVNLAGERFVDEGEDLPISIYAKLGAEVVKQPHGLAFQLFDARTVPLLDPRYATATAVEADSLPGLADELGGRYGARGFRGETLLITLEAYNAAVQEGPFEPQHLDGRRTIGLRPEKTNWATRLDQPPFRAYAVTAGLSFTFGGLRTNRRAEVVDQLDRPLPGLFAAGDITGGFFSFNYPGGGGLTRALVFGRIAGRGAARFACSRPAPSASR